MIPFKEFLLSHDKITNFSFTYTGNLIVQNLAPILEGLKASKSTLTKFYLKLYNCNYYKEK